MFDRIDVQPDEPAAGGEARAQFPGVPAEAERAIDRVFTGSEREHRENLSHHNRAVTAGGRFAGGEHFGDVGGVALWVQFFVFIRKPPGIFARIARTAPVRSGRNGGRIRIGG